MRLNPKLPLSDRFQSRIAAQSLVYHSFNIRAAVAELRPDVKMYGKFGKRLMNEPAVLYEIGVIMDRTEGRAQRFLDKMWKWLDDETPGKESNEMRQTAARILAKGYIREKGPADAPVTQPMVIEGLGDGISNLTGEQPVKIELDKGKVN